MKLEFHITDAHMMRGKKLVGKMALELFIAFLNTIFGPSINLNTILIYNLITGGAEFRV